MPISLTPPRFPGYFVGLHFGTNRKLSRIDPRTPTWCFWMLLLESRLPHPSQSSIEPLETDCNPFHFPSVHLRHFVDVKHGLLNILGLSFIDGTKLNDWLSFILVITINQLGKQRHLFPFFFLFAFLSLSRFLIFWLLISEFWRRIRNQNLWLLPPTRQARAVLLFVE